MDIIKGLNQISDDIKGHIEEVDNILMAVEAIRGKVQRLRDNIMRDEFRVRDARAAILGAVHSKRLKREGGRENPPLTGKTTAPSRPVVKLKPEHPQQPDEPEQTFAQEESQEVQVGDNPNTRLAGGHHVWFSRDTGRRSAVMRPGFSDGTDFVLPKKAISNMRKCGMSKRQIGIIIERIKKRFPNWQVIRMGAAMRAANGTSPYGIHRPNHSIVLAYIIKATADAALDGRAKPEFSVKRIADDCGLKLSTAYNICNSWRAAGLLFSGSLKYKVVRIAGKAGPAIVIGSVSLSNDFPIDAWVEAGK